MSSFFGIGAAASAAGNGTVATLGAIVVAGVGGAVAAGAIAVASTQVAANVTQPSSTSQNLNNVNAPQYGDE